MFSFYLRGFFNEYYSPFGGQNSWKLWCREGKLKRKRHVWNIMITAPILF